MAPDGTGLVARWPNLFIIGGPRCGTVALRDMLAAHPDVFFPDIPEAHYFGTDLARYRLDGLTQEVFLSLFTPGNDRRWRGESSPFSVYSQDAAALARASCPDARIIVSVRDLVDLLHANHHGFLATGAETEPDLERAIAREDAAPDSGALSNPAYAPLTRLAEGITRYQEVFGRDRVTFVEFGDLLGSPAVVYGRLCAFLGIAPQQTIPTTTAWPAVRPKRNLLRRVWYDAIPYRTRQRLKGALPLDDRRAFRIYAALRFRFARMTTELAQRPRLDPAARARLESRFSKERAALDHLISQERDRPWAMA